MVFVLVGLVLGFGALIVGETEDSIVTTTGCNETAGCNVTADDCCTEHYSYNATGNVNEGLDTMGSWQPILAIVIVAGLVITLLIGSFMFQSRA